jgi:hypothetical protein
MHMPAKLDRQHWWISGVIFLGTFLIYLANCRTISACDNLPNTILLFHWLEHRTWNMAEFVAAGIDNPSCKFLVPTGTPPQWISGYPIGSALVSAPLYILFYLHFKFTHGLAAIPLTDLNFHNGSRAIYEKWAAVLIAASSVVMFFHLARQFFSRQIAGAVTLIFAFASTTWSASSQGLWQHGTLNLLVVTLLVLLVGKQRDRRWLILAGIVWGLIPGTRPTAGLLCLPALVYCLWQYRRRSWLFIGGGLSCLPALIWNTYWFKSPILGGYQLQPSDIGIAHFPTSFPGLLFSPSRGLFICSPILLLAMPGLWLLWQRRRHSADWLILAFALAGAGIIWNYSCFMNWWGGGSYGPRLLTDLLPILCLLGGYGLTMVEKIRWSRWLRSVIATLILALACYSTLVQYAGVVLSPFSNWNVTPILVDLPQGRDRLWDWHDAQPIRALRGLQYGHLSQQRMTPQAMQDFQGRILSLSTDRRATPITQLKGQPQTWIYLQVQMQNTSPFVWYGSDYSLGKGEAAVVGVIVDAQHKPVQPPISLAVMGKYAPQEVAIAYNYIALPAQPGDYELRLWPGMAALPSPEPPHPFTIPLHVADQP